MEYLSHSVAHTEDFAAGLGALLRPGHVVALWGGLGAGKTAFVRGLARGMGVRGRVSSPTFTLMREHAGPVPLAHFDLYRLTPDGVDELALDDWFGGTHVCAVEWPQNAGDALPPERLDVTLETVGDDARRILIEARGAACESIVKELQP